MYCAFSILIHSYNLDWSGPTTGCIPGYNIDTKTVSTNYDCKRLCDNNPACHSIDFQLATRICFMNSITKTTNPWAFKTPCTKVELYFEKTGCTIGKFS